MTEKKLDNKRKYGAKSYKEYLKRAGLYEKYKDVVESRAKVNPDIYSIDLLDFK